MRLSQSCTKTFAKGCENCPARRTWLACTFEAPARELPESER